MRKLSNDELATRTREANRRRGERHRERLTIAGRAALTVWVPVGLRSRFVNEAAASGVNINELATRLIEKGLRESQLIDFISSDPQPDTADMFATAEPEPQTPVVVADASAHNTVSVDSGRTAIMMLVTEMLADGLTGAEIARRLNADGYRAVSGKELVGHNLLREYRAWKAKADESNPTAV